MSRFNTKSTRMVGNKSAVRTTDTRVATHNGYLGWERDEKSELFLLAVSFMGGDDNFYEKSAQRYDRLFGLVEKVAISDPEWLVNMIRWVRNEAYMRTVAGVIAVEGVRARLEHAKRTLDERHLTSMGMLNREMIDAACARADEPGEIVAYWQSKYDKKLPKPIKNGVADALVRLLNERSFLKYGQKSNAAVSAADVIRLTHPKPKDSRQASLFKYITTLEHRGKEAATALARESFLPVLRYREAFYAVPQENRVAWLEEQGFEALNRAGVTWEALSEWFPGGMTAKAWEAVIPNMGIMALIRNLRNFDKAGISEPLISLVQKKLSDEDEIMRSKLFPFRFYQASLAVQSVRWLDALDKGLTLSTRNIPTLPGRTLLLVDMSGSMFGSTISDKSEVKYSDSAALFGSAWALSNPDNTDLYQFGGGAGWYGSSRSTASERVPVPRGGSVLNLMKRFRNMGGTELHRAVSEAYAGQDRVVILTDEQASLYYGPSLPPNYYDDLPVTRNVPVYIWNYAGYQAGVTVSGKYQRHTFGGFSDTAFKLISYLESGQSTGWPWEVESESSKE